VADASARRATKWKRFDDLAASRTDELTASRRHQEGIKKIGPGAQFTC
jgi:hypothetical protein